MAKRSKDGKRYVPVKVKLDPTPRQEKMLASHCGAARFAQNWALGMHISALENGEEPMFTAIACRKKFNEVKNDIAPWWDKNSKEAYSSGFANFERAIKSFYDSKNGKHKGIRVGFPKFKAKGRSVDSFCYTTGSFGVADDHGVKCPRIGRVHTLENVRKRVGESHVTRMTIKRETDGWYAILLTEVDDTPSSPKTKGGEVGVDIGTRKALVLSDGTVYQNPRRLDQHLAELRKLDKKMARQRQQNDKHWKSNRYQRAKKKRAVLYKRVANLRREFWYQVANDICRKHRTVYIEDLNVSGMMRGHNASGRKRRRDMADMSFGMFRNVLCEVAEKHGVEVHAIDRFYPSSKTCCACHSRNDELGSNEVFRCGNCGLVIDRDYNAAINILDKGRAECQPDHKRRGGDVRPLTFLADGKPLGNVNLRGFQTRQPDDQKLPSARMAS